MLGGRVLGGFVGTAPLAGGDEGVPGSCLDVHVADGYGLTEIGAVTRDGMVLRPPVIDYKLIDVPELGYFLTDKPYPRGELLVKSRRSHAGLLQTPRGHRRGVRRRRLLPHRRRDGRDRARPAVYVDRRKNVLKLAQGEFVAVANLEAVFAAAPLVRQIFVYGNSERSYLLAVIVPTPDALEQFARDAAALKAALRESLQETANAAELQSYEMPRGLPDRDRTVQRRQRLAFRGRQDAAAQAQGALRRAA